MDPRERLARWLLKERFDQIMYGGLKFEGIIRGRRVPPFDTRDDFERWWLPEMVNGKIIREARMTPREKDRYTVIEGRNTLVTNGRNAILTYIGSATGHAGSGNAFAQYFGVGTGPINFISAGDTGLQFETFRAVPSTAIIMGVQLDLATYFSAAQAQATYTDAGLFGLGAGPAIGSGTLLTHSFYPYTKGNWPLISDYLISQA